VNRSKITIFKYLQGLFDLELADSDEFWWLANLYCPDLS